MVRHYREAHLAVDGLGCVQAKDNENYPFCYSNFRLNLNRNTKIGSVLHSSTRGVWLV